jgi:hypothetical protein
MRGGEILRVATSRKTSTHMHQRMGVQSHMGHALLTPPEFQEVAWCLPHTCVWWSDLINFGPTYQKSMTGWSTPPPRVPADLLHLHPRCRGDEAIMANYFPIALTGPARSWLMNLPEGTLGS